MTSSIDFGKDTTCTDSLRTGRYSTGVRLVAEAAYRRLITPRGMLRGGEEEANYGLDLSQLIGSSEPRLAAAALPGQVRAELLKDERILDVQTTVTVTTEGPATAFLVDIVGTTAAGPFRLKLAVSDVTVELLGIEATT